MVGPLEGFPFLAVLVAAPDALGGLYRPGRNPLEGDHTDPDARGKVRLDAIAFMGLFGVSPLPNIAQRNMATGIAHYIYIHIYIYTYV